MNSTPNDKCGKDNMNCCKPTRPCDCDCEALQAQIDELREELGKKPELFDLEILDGFSYSVNSYYYKSKEGIVTVTCGVTFDELNNLEAVAVLPEGFRPERRKETPATIHSGAGGFKAAHVRIESDGVVLARIDQSLERAGFYFQTSFVSAQ